MGTSGAKLCFSASSLSILLIVFLAATVYSAQSNRPFWTEKSSFLEWEELFVVGVSSRARSVEEARKQAFENGRIELMNYAQITNLEARGLVIETQMTYEEEMPDGSVTVYRLLKVPVKKLLEVQDRVRTESRRQEQSVEKATQDLAAIQQGLETKTRKVEQQQRELESLLRNLEGQFALPKGTSLQTTTEDSLASRLEIIETTLTTRERELAEISRLAKARISDESVRNAKHCALLVIGMTDSEASSIMGEPRKKELSNWWLYGVEPTITLHMIDGYLSDIKHEGHGRSTPSGCPPQPPQVAAKVQSAKVVDITLKVPGMAPGSNAYLALVRQRISNAWNTPTLDLSCQAYVVVVQFRLYRNGTVTGVVIEQSSGNEYYDLAGKRAVLSANPFPMFPADIIDPYFDAHFTVTVSSTAKSVSFP